MNVPTCDIEDVVQEAWLSVIVHAEQFTGVDVQRRVRCWLRQVVHGKAVDLLRHRCSCPCESLDEEEVDLIDDMEAMHMETAERRECLEALLEKVRRGNEENLRLLNAHFYQEASIREVAGESGRTAKSVECRIRRLLDKLRELAEPLFRR